MTPAKFHRNLFGKYAIFSISFFGVEIKIRIMSNYNSDFILKNYMSINTSERKILTRPPFYNLVRVVEIQLFYNR